MSDQSRRVPADRGLSGLGLIMQLAGSVFGAVTTMMGVSALITASATSEFGGRADSSVLLWTLVVAATGVARSLAHRSAGADLVYGQSPFAGIRRYLTFAVVNTGAWILFLVSKLHAPFSAVLPVVSLLLVWPVALLIMTTTAGFRELGNRMPATEDKGFEGASLLMLVFGVIGFLCTSVALYMLWTGTPSEAHGSGIFVMIIIALVVLVIRSGIHVNAGLTGLRETRLDQAVAAANRYADFGVVASFVTGGALLMAMMMTAPDATGLAVIGCLVWALLAWPLILRRFFGERQFADMMASAEGGPAHHRAPDLGLTTLGWFLLAQALMSLSFSLPAMLVSHGGDGMGGDNPLSMFTAMLGGAGDHSQWWSIGVAAIQLWAGFELVRMGELHRIAASAYGVIAVVVSIYLDWSILGSLGRMGEDLRDSPFIILMLGLQITVPLVTLFAANRSAMPAATARYTGQP